MSRAQVPQSAIDASLWVILGHSLADKTPPSAGSQPVPAEASEAVGRMLAEQGSAELESAVLETIRAGLHALGRDPSLTLSASRYDALRGEFMDSHRIHAGKGRTLWPVGSTTILKRASGSWSQALAHAGLAVSAETRPAGFGRARFTSEQFSAAIFDFTSQALREGSSTSYQNYVAWRKRQQQAGRTDLPSGPAIRNSFGSWSAALDQEGTSA
ncbi:hypothetical protein [Nesterenkonia muleiensis]|uniref:hypothetical protein n=1 Tax=Nesterenkonia muleiensis TaxID=2282648 RepID=UPI000E72DE22|nr:hypothetical protein [Nesterenkonia muleiensis]